MGTGIELSNAPVWSGDLIGSEVIPMGRGDGQPWAMEISSIFQLQNYVVVSDLVAATLDTNLVGRNIVVAEPLSLYENLAWPTDRMLNIVYGGRVTISSGMALSFTSDSLLAGKYHIFSGVGSVTGLKVAYPEWFASNSLPGTTDMTAATQAACNALLYGGKLEISEDHLLTSTVEIKYPILITSGSASYNRARFINTSDTALNMFYVSAGHGTTFKDIALWGTGNKTGTSKGVLVGDGTNNIDMVTFDNCEIYGFATGIDLKTQNWRIGNNTLLSTCGIGVLMTGLPTADNRRNGYIVDSWLRSCDTGVSIPNVWFSVGINDNDFNSCGNGIVGALARSSTNNNKFHNMTGNEINITSTASSTNMGVTIADNVIHGSGTANTGTGITLTGDYATIHDNIINAKGGHGIAVVGSFNKIHHNTAKDCDYFNTTTYDGINVAGNSNKIDDNICRTTTNGASKQRYGINIASGTSNVVKDNTVDGNKSGQISADIATNTVKQNVGYKTENKGSASTSSGTSVVVNHGLAINPPTGSIFVTSMSNLGGASFWISNVTSTQFTINVSSSGSYPFWWQIN